MSAITVKLPDILNGKLFKVINSGEDDLIEIDAPSGLTPKRSNKVLAECQKCPQKTRISGSIDSTGNFYKHLRRKHPGAIDNFKRVSKRLLDQDSISDATASSPKPKRMAMATATTVTPFKICEERKKLVHSVTNEKLEDLVLSYLEEEMLPIYTVEKSSFKKLVSGLTGGQTLPCRRTIMVRMQERRKKIDERLVSVLKQVDHCGYLVFEK